MDTLKHRDGCHPSQRRTEIIAPVTGFRCRNCGAEEDKHQQLQDLLRHCKMFIFEGTGYCATREEELELLKAEMKKLGV